jgi:CRP-like cAMP-binding protein
MENFLKTISALCPLSPGSLSEISGITTEFEFPKGYLLVKPHTVCRHLFFIEQGLSRTFYLKDGREITDWISPENTFAVSLISFITRQPDRRGIELLEPSAICSLSNEALEKLCRENHEVEHLVRLLLSMGFVQLQQKFDDAHFTPAIERYQKLLASTPELLQRVPLGMIASFLGMTQETLSRIRSRK